jgi:ornithine carbamoyltransferase
MAMSAKMGVNFIACGPKALWPAQEIIDRCEPIAKQNGSTIKFTENMNDATVADVIYTDVWLSMGEDPAKWEERINLLKPYQVNMEFMNKTKDTSVFMHALPSFHNIGTTIGADIYQRFGLKEMEVSDEVFESKKSIVFDEAENRMHTIKAVMYLTMSDGDELNGPNNK